MTKHAYCGLDCTQCPIYKAAHDQAYAEQCAKELQAEGHPDATAQWFTCKGCRGDEALLYDKACKIRACAIAKEHEHCGHCQSYPCHHLEAFAKQGDTACKAVESLKAK